ncbi:DUF3991 domain-containing protein [Staphylococcus caprae]|uniref:DUF3991 domain-containing protein n=1 Tax=Staphylococcus caprae TaxID=29380 RepID=UPI000CD23925|nr:DUF3991 domain-containing protein [Staphylococcus caprae]POA06085.1 topoisomerase [Staphylococcus caprae]SUL89829.1 LtrC-like protein [Staphylococcus caprae]
MKNEITDLMVKRVKEFQKDPQKVKEYLDFVAKSPNYSYRNLILIQAQYPSAQYVGSYQHFKNKGFHVNRGEKGIKILAPKFKEYVDVDGKLEPLHAVDQDTKNKVKMKELEVTRKFNGYKPSTVFDVTQTNAKADEIPEYYPNRREKLYTSSPQATESIYQSLKQIAIDNNIEVIDNYTGHTFSNKDIGGAEKGVSAKTKNNDHIIGLRQGLDPVERNHTFIHELTHSLYHHDDSRSLNLEEKETEAEMVAYVVSQHYGIEPSENSIKYIAEYSNNMRDIKDTADALRHVTKSSKNFINDINKNIDYEKLQEIQNEIDHSVLENPETHRTTEESKNKTEISSVSHNSRKSEYVSISKEKRDIAKNKSIIDVLNQNGHDIVHDRGNYYKDKTNPHIYVNQKKNIYYDKEKKRGGDPIRCLVNIGMTYSESVNQLNSDQYKDKTQLLDQQKSTSKDNSKDSNNMKDKIKVAEEKSILEVATLAGQSFKRAGRFYQGIEHDSLMLKPDDNAFFWNSHRGDKNWSGSPIQFIQNPELAGDLYKDNFKDAVELLNSQDIGNYNKDLVTGKKAPSFSYNEDNYVKRIDAFKSYDYLTSTRKIDDGLVTDLTNQGLIKQDKYNNVVFLWKDHEDKVVGQDLRGTGEKPFKKIDTDQGHFGFNFKPGNVEPNNLLIFEAPIDAMSYASLHPNENNAYASMSGLKETNAYAHVNHFVKKYQKEPENVILCVDNDEPGQAFAEQMTEKVKYKYPSDNDITFKTHLPDEGKDWNDFLKSVEENKTKEQNDTLDKEKFDSKNIDDIGLTNNKKKKRFVQNTIITNTLDNEFEM